MEPLSSMSEHFAEVGTLTLEQAFRQSEERFQQAFQYAPIGMALLAPDGRWLNVNQALCRITGYAPEELLKLTFQDITHPDDLASDMVLARQLVAGQIPSYEREKRYLRKDGAAIWIYLIASAIRDDAGKTLYVISQIQDITERKDSEKREARYRALIEKSHNAITLWSADGAILYASPSIARITGRRPEEVVGRSFLEWIPAEDHAALSASLESFLRQPGATNTAYQRFQHKDGSWRWVESTSTNLLHDPAVEAVVSSFEDITQRKRAEDALHEWKDRYETAILASEQVLYEWNNETNELTWGGSHEQIFGYPHEEMPRTLKECTRLIHPDDWPAFEDEAARVVATGKPFMLSYRVRRKDGGIIHVEDRGHFLKDAQGKATRMLGFVADVTEKKQAERALRQWKDRYEDAVRSSNRILYDWNVAANETVYGGAVESMLGYDRADLQGSLDRWLDLIHPDDRETVRQEMHRHMVAKAPFRMEYRVRRKDGAYIPIQDDGHCRFDPAGNLTGVVGFLSDLTRQRSLEDQLRQAQKMEAVGQLAGGVAHDFNNLLTIITGYSEILLQTMPDDAPSRNFLQEIRNAGERSASLTRQLLAFSRRQMLAPKVLNLNDIVDGMGKLLRRTIGEDIQFSTALSSDLGNVRADPGQIEQVLLNLIVNARDAMPQGGKLTIETRNLTIDNSYSQAHAELPLGEYVLLAVSDTGSGMTADVKRHIFEPFFTTKGPGRGTGLGLAVVHGIVKQSGGEISVYSELGQGSTFKVLLPRIVEAASVEEVTPTASTMPRGNETVLLVEDEDGVRAITRHVLKLCGYDVLEASNGEEALKLVARTQRTFQLVLTDVVMPGIGGRSLVEKLVADRPEIKVLYLSGYTDDAVVRHGILHEQVNFLQKPFTPLALAKKVRAVLDS